MRFRACELSFCVASVTGNGIFYRVREGQCYALFQEFSETVTHKFQNRIYRNSYKYLLLETSSLSSDSYISHSIVSRS